MDDKEIILSVLDGDSDAFGLLVERYSAQIYRICRSLCGNTSDAEDATQETFIDAFRYLAALKDRSKFCPWLCSIARRKSYKQIHSRSIAADIDEMAEFLSSGCDFTDEEVIRTENRERVRRALDKLSPKRRAVCEMFYFRNMKISEISKKLSLSENTVKSRLYDAREYLRKELDDMNENKENIALLEEKIKEQIKTLSYYYALNGMKYDENYNSRIKETTDLVDKLADEKTRQYYLADLLTYQSFAEKDEEKKKAILEKRDQAAETGKNVSLIADQLVNELFGKQEDGEALRFLDEVALPKIEEYASSPDYGYAKGTMLFWRGRKLLSLGRADEAKDEFRSAASLLDRSEAYQANAVAALRSIDNMAKNALDPLKGYEVTAEGLIYEIGRLIFYNQPGFSNRNNMPGLSSDFNCFLYFIAECKRVIFDENMKPGEKLTDDKGSLECVSYDESVAVAAGSFDGCMHTKTDVTNWMGHYIIDAWYAPKVGLIKVLAKCGGKAETYELTEYTVNGGEGYYPFAVGNRWVYRNPDTPSYIYSDIERTVEYTDGCLTNMAITSPITLIKDYENCEDIDSYVYLSFADNLCDDWKFTEAIEMLRKAVRLNINEEAVRISLFSIEVLTRFAEYQKKGYRFCPSSIGADYLKADDNSVKYDKPYFFSLGRTRYGARGRYEDRIFGIKPFRYLDRFMGCLWDEKWVPGYREEKPTEEGLTLVFTVEDGGSVAVPAGEFGDCRKITIRVDKPADKDDNWYFSDWYRHMDAGVKEYWFAPGVGIVKCAFTWGEECYAECLLSSYKTLAAKDSEYLPIQIGNEWEYDEPHLTEEGYRAKAIFSVSSGINGRYLMTRSQEFVFLGSEEEYNKLAESSHRY